MQANDSLGLRPLLAAVLAYLVITPVLSTAQAPAKSEKINATTANLTVGNGESLKINVLAWTPAAEREKMVAAFQEKGEDQLLEAMKSASSAGYIWTSETLGYTLRYAHKMPLPNGGERIILITDRPLGSWSRTAWKASATKDKEAKLTVVEIRLNAQGRGEGKMSLAAGITAQDEGKTIALDNYAAAPVLLKNVARVNDSPTH
jgi:hypothetical protein